MIIGMDIEVFTAWILTILAAILCVAYGIYHEIIKKDKKQKKTSTKTKEKKEEEN